MKRYFRLAVLTMLVFSLAGCGKQAKKDEETQSQPPQLEESSGTPLAEGETVTIDGECEFHVDYVAISENPEHYYEAEDGKTYVDFCITYKNLGDYTISASNVMKGRMIYSGLYEYEGTAMAAAEGDDSLSPAHWIDLGSSDTAQIHYFITVPRQVQGSGRMVELDMSIRENDYRVVVRDGERGAVSAEGDTGAQAKTSGEVAAGEVVSTDNARFYVEHGKFTKEIIPPGAGSAYMYYTAEDGKVFVDFCVAYTNLSGKKITAAKAISASLDQAEAQTTVTEQSGRHSFDYSDLVNVIPLCTEYIHYIFQVPEELESGSEQVTISFKIDGNRYMYIVR